MLDCVGWGMNKEQSLVSVGLSRQTVSKGKMYSALKATCEESQSGTTNDPERSPIGTAGQASVNRGP